MYLFMYTRGKRRYMKYSIDLDHTCNTYSMFVLQVWTPAKHMVYAI